jgi:hypothetical protein
MKELWGRQVRTTMGEVRLDEGEMTRFQRRKQGNPWLSLPKAASRANLVAAEA